MKKIDIINKFVFVLLFFCLIFSPYLMQVSGLYNDDANFENREKAHFPSLSINQSDGSPESYIKVSDYTVKFLDYLNDNFPFRNALFDLFREIKLQLFHVSPLPDRIIVGDRGWYFMGDFFGDVIKETKGIKVFTKEKLRKCVDNVVKYDSLLADAGIKFYFSVAPDKSSVYGDFLPIAKSGVHTKLEQLKFALAKTNIELIDLKEGFTPLPKVSVYYKKDSHWNHYGAFLAYQFLMKKIQVDFPKVQPLSLTDFKIETASGIEEDLSKLLRIKARESSFRLKQLTPNKAVEIEKRLSVPVDYPHRKDFYEHRYICEGKSLKVLIFSDSFFRAITPLITQGFGETVVLWTRINYDIIKIEKPDIVISESVEREVDKFVSFQ
jgi:alginate O-acetyltransferase complex protein AlgJ